MFYPLWKMIKNKKHEWLESDYELLFNGLSRIVHNQEQIIKGIVALARKEGMEIHWSDEKGNKVVEDNEEVK